MCFVIVICLLLLLFVLVHSQRLKSELFSVGRMREKVGLKVVKALKRSNVGVTHAALDMLCALMQVRKDQRVDCTNSAKAVKFGSNCVHSLLHLQVEYLLPVLVRLV